MASEGGVSHRAYQMFTAEAGLTLGQDIFQDDAFVAGAD